MRSESVGPAWSRWLPTRGNVLFTLLAIIVALWANNTLALPFDAPQVPVVASTNTIPYQGRLANTSGAPLTGTYSMRFRLYAAATGGVPLWEEQWTNINSVQVRDGLFNVMLGSLSPIPQSVFMTNTSLWLGISVGTDNEMSPRVQLGTAPFAIQALIVPDSSITSVKLTDGSVTTTKLADGSVTSTKLQRAMTKIIADQYITMTNHDVNYDILTLNINLQRETLVTIHGSVGCQTPTDGLCAGSVLVDGTQVIHTEIWVKALIGEQAMMSTVVSLGPGSHQVKLRAFSWLDNAVIAGDDRTQLVVIEG